MVINKLYLDLQHLVFFFANNPTVNKEGREDTVGIAFGCPNDFGCYLVEGTVDIIDLDIVTNHQLLLFGMFGLPL